MNYDHRYWSPQLGYQDFVLPADSEHIFNKMEIKNWLHRIQSGIALIGNPQSKPLHYVHPLMGRAFKFYIPIHKVLE